jgi:hypothetical protein
VWEDLRGIIVTAMSVIREEVDTVIATPANVATS